MAVYWLVEDPILIILAIHRNVKVADGNVLNGVMESIKRKGFINYYGTVHPLLSPPPSLMSFIGMQRFGTASVPTHAIGLALLQSNWARAVSLLLQPRPGEFPEAEAARRAWLEDKDLDKALELMPRRVVAERCILESFKKQGGESRNCMGALSTVREGSVCFALSCSCRVSTIDPKKSSADVCPCIPVVCLECDRLGTYQDIRL